MALQNRTVGSANKPMMIKIQPRKSLFSSFTSDALCIAFEE